MTSPLRLLILAILWATGGTVIAQEISLAEAKRLFSDSDKKLNEAYQKAKSALPDYRFAKIQQEQRDWLEHRDAAAMAAAHFDGGAKEGEEEQNVEYWTALGYLTDTRTSILKAWLRTDSFEKEWEGVWIDGYGGRMGIIERSPGKLLIRIEVVRGPTHHVGDIGGPATAKDRTARFSLQIEGEDETWLTLIRRDGEIELIGENTMYFHGARAYFDGEYIRVGELTPEDRESVENPPQY